MRNTGKKFLILLLALTLCLTLLPLRQTASAAEIVASGDCGAEGSSVTWTLDADGVLTIAGEGATKNFGSYENAAPWSDLKGSIKTLIVEGGVTYLGEDAFSSCESLERVVLPGNCALSGFTFSECPALKSVEGLPAHGEGRDWDYWFTERWEFNYGPSPSSVSFAGTKKDWYFTGYRILYSSENPESITVTCSDGVLYSEEEPFIVNSGKCGAEGSDISWSLDSDGVLRITGEGELPRYSVFGEHQGAWKIHTYHIKDLVLGGGIRASQGAFDSSEDISCDYLFNTVTLLDGFEDIPDSFLEFSSVQSIFIPSSVKSIGDYAFDYTGIANVYYAGAEAQWNAITIGEGNDDLLAATMHYNYTAPQAEPQPTPQPPVTPAPVKVQFAKQAAYAEGQYSDVPAGKWYARSVASAYELGLMKGNADGSFNPNGNVTLAEAVTMAARIHSLYTTGAESFPKGEGKWYQPYLDYAREKGIISEETFSSDANRALTRAQFAQILAAALPAEALPAVNTVALGAIPDVKGDSPAFDAIYTLYRAGILIGNDKAGTFKPDSALTRAETAAIVTRMADSDSRLSITLY